MIQFFSLDLLFDNELALRMGAIVISVINTLVIFSIGKNLKNELTGLYAAFLFNASIYCSVLAGNFIIPDTPQLLFWLLSLKYLLIALPAQNIDRKVSGRFLLASLFAGLAILSKYHGVFIWAGTGLYVLIYNRKWFQTPVFYLGMVLSAFFLLPILVWNYQNSWISFTFHGDRVSSALVFRPDYLLTELLGQFAYNNPINYILIVVALVTAYRQRLHIDKAVLRLLILNSLPIWLVFTSFSFFRQTLPHWTGPAFTPLILIAAIYLSNKFEVKATEKSKLLIPGSVSSSLILMYSLLIVAWALINFYPGTIGKKNTVSKFGDTDFTLDMYGWDQIKTGFEMIAKENVRNNTMSVDAPIISPKYFPGTEIDYYVARPLGKKVLLLGSLPNIHKYAWINEARGKLEKGEDAYMISTSNWYKDPFEYYQEHFEEIIPTDTLTIKRSGNTAYYAFIYSLRGYKGDFPDPFLNQNKKFEH
ncbi:MAG: glycosyltransferase family 39 protein [Cyclobacteriaceae bacterium]|nr:glycosyltransferase family 39 protein [Cyclobacteriaceae bacterium]